MYDYLDNSEEQTRNPDHRYAMQPIVLKYANKDGFADYNNGLTPSEEIEEDIRNYGTLGEIDEPYLAMALSLISGTGKSTPAKAEWNKSLLFSVNDENLEIEKSIFFGEKKIIDSSCITISGNLVNKNKIFNWEIRKNI